MNPAGLHLEACHHESEFVVASPDLRAITLLSDVSGCPDFWPPFH